MANPTQNGVLKRDDNDYPVMGGTSTVDNATIINSSFDPITRRLLTTGSGGATSITVTDGVTTVSNVTTLDFTSGATVTAGTTGVANVAVTGGGSGTPGGLNTQLQYNNNGVFGGITGAVTDGTAVSLNAAHLLNPTINGAGTGLATLAYPNTSSSATITLPTVTGTLATLAGTETLTNKTLTAPTITGATITTSTVNGVTLTTGGSSTTFLNGSGTYTTPAGAGTVTSVSVVTANGFAGTVATATSTPAITLTTSVTGVLKGNGTAISTATSGTDYSAGTSALTTGILKSTTATGVLSIAVAADFPTLNQNTTGSAATLTTARTIGIATGDATSAGSTFDGSANNTNALTLATVNSNVGSFTNANITVNGKGLITAASNGTAGLTTLTVGTTTITSGTTTRMLYDNGGVLGETTGITTNGTVATLASPVLNGTISGTGVATATTASTLVLRDANANNSANNFLQGYTTTTTAAGTTTLAVGSTYEQYFTGSSTQTVTLPVASTLVLGQEFLITNLSTGTVTVQSSGANAVVQLAAGTSARVTCILTSGTTAASWNATYYGAIVNSGNKLVVSANLTLAGTNGTTQTFPSTSATIARTDAAQTFTGVQTFSSAPVISSITNTGTITLPTTTTTLAGLAVAETFTATQTASLWNTNPQALSVTTNAATADINHGIQNFTNSSAAAMTITLTTTSATDGQFKEIRIYDFSAVAQTITFVNTENSTVTVPTTSNGSTTLPLSVLFQFNGPTSKWRCLASS